ncbi:MAG TPA: PAS domain-containing protein [Candidatus Dormibacteraeota bacterium]|nr:PAS domain-containing protein [Candidatus Dormibacteraeota bacterium]
MAARPPAPIPAPARAGTESDAPLFAALLTQLPGLVWASDRQLCCQFASALASRRLGLAAGTAIASGLAQANDAGTALLDGHRAALAGTAAQRDLVLGGARFSCLLEPLRDGSGAVIGVLGSAEAAADDHARHSVESQRAVLASALAHAPEGIAVCDTDGRFLYVNEAAKRFADRETMDSRIADDAAFWGQWYDDRGPLQIADWPLTLALQGEVVPPVELYKPLPDGSRQYMSIGTAPLRDPLGAIIGAVATAVDITSRKRAEEQVRELNQDLERRVQVRTAELEHAIREREREAGERQEILARLARSEQLLNDIVNHSPAVIFLKDLDGRYLLVNRRYENLFGVDCADWIGRTDHELFPKEVADALRANDLRVAEAGTSMHIEEVVPTAECERTYLSIKFPLRDREGAIYGVCGMATDITERQQIEAALRRSEATLASIIESSSDPICAISRDWQLVAMNTACSSFVSALIGSLPEMKAPLGAIPEDFAAQWRGLLERGMAGERFTVERTLSISGAARHFLVSFNPTVQDEVVTGVAIFGREITELRRAEEGARQHQAELAHVLRLHTMGEMAASLAHEVNQPLGAIANYAQGCRNRLKAGKADTVELLHTVEAITREALRAGEITRRVRELLRKEEAPRAWVDAAELIRAALDIVVATARRHDVVVTARCDLPPLPILVDQIQIEQVVINLMLNAIEATRTTREPRLVEVRAGRTGDVVEIAISDTGVGIDQTLAERIFEPFLTTKPGGLGMGLAISRSIVSAHGGQLWYTPNPGGGTTFHFTLPPDRP